MEEQQSLQSTTTEPTVLQCYINSGIVHKNVDLPAGEQQIWQTTTRATPNPSFWRVETYRDWPDWTCIVYLDIYRIMQLAPKYRLRWWRTPIGWVGNWTRNGEVVKRKIPAEIFTGQAAEKALQWCFAQIVPVQSEIISITTSNQLVRPHPLQSTAFWKMLLLRCRWRYNCPLSPRNQRRKARTALNCLTRTLPLWKREKMLNDEHIRFATEHLCEQFPNARGLQRTIFGQNLSFQKTTPFCADTVQQWGTLGDGGGYGSKYDQGLWQHQPQAVSVSTSSGLVHAEDSYGPGLHSFSAGEDAVTEGRGGLWSLWHCLCNWTLQWQQSSKLQVRFRGLLYVSMTLVCLCSYLIAT